MKKENLQKQIALATTKVASEFFVAKQSTIKANTKVPDGTLNNIIISVTTKHNLPTDSIKHHTLYLRLKRNNLSGVAHQKVPPLLSIEPLLVALCLKMARLGMAMTKRNVIELAMELIVGTDDADKLAEFKKKRHLQTKDGERIVVERRWYNSFIKRNKEELRQGRCKIKDQKRRTWCTFEHFSNMYEGVYKAMVESKVAVKLNEEVMLDGEGNIVSNVQDMVGQPTKYKLTNPENVITVDETVCNTNMKKDGYVGGEWFVLPTNPSEAGRARLTTNIEVCYVSQTPLVNQFFVRLFEIQKESC
jgi:hypothetical protein